MTWQPGPEDGTDLPARQPPEQPVSDPGAAVAAGPGVARRAARWTAMIALLAVGLCGLAGAVVGIAIQLLPRHFTAAQQRQLMTWEMTRRWRALPAASIFPATVTYQVPAAAVYAPQDLALTARRLGLAEAASCADAVSADAARVLAAARCSAALRATYVDSSGSFVATVGVAVLPDSQAAVAAAHRLWALHRDLSFALRPLAVAGSPASQFRDRQRQFSLAVGAGPYVLMSTAGFTDGRGHVRLATDFYYTQEMTGLADGLVRAAERLLGARPPVPRCPGAPGC